MKFLITIIDRLEPKNGGEVHGHWSVETDIDLCALDYDKLVAATAQALNYGLDQFDTDDGFAVEVKNFKDLPTFDVHPHFGAPKFPDLGCDEDENPEGCAMSRAGNGFECQATLACGHKCGRYVHPGDKHFDEIKEFHDYWINQR